MYFQPVCSWDFVEGLFPFEMQVWEEESFNAHAVFCPPSQLFFVNKKQKI